MLNKPETFRYTLEGRVLNAADAKTPITLAHIIETGTGLHYLTDAKGEFVIKSARPIQEITVNADRHYPQKIAVADSSFITIRLAQVYPWDDGEGTELPTRLLVKRMLGARKRNNPDAIGDYQCQLYHKLSVRTDSLAAIKQLINAGFRIFSQPLLDAKAPFHYLFLAEANSKKYYYKRRRQKEILDGVRISGIQQFSGNLPIAQLQGFSAYQDYITVQGSDYIGPFAGNPFRRYIFSIRDTIPLPDDTLVLIRFSPKPFQKVKTLRGYLLISLRDFGVAAAVFMPGINDQLELGYNQLTQVYRRTYDGKHPWAPFTYRALFLKPEAFGNVPFELVQEGYTTAFRPFEFSDGLKTPDQEFIADLAFNGVVMEPLPEASKRDSLYWIANRPVSLSKPEYNTYRFYNQVGSIKSIDRLLGLTEQLYYGQLAYGPWAIDLNKVITFNPYEALRLGVGLSKTWLNQKVKTSGYWGYGFQDKAQKYGFGAELRLDSSLNWRLGVKHLDDLTEPGQPVYFNDKPVFDSERLRKYMVPRFDRINYQEVYTNMQLSPRFGYSIGAQWKLQKPLYNYQYLKPASDGQVYTGQPEFYAASWQMGFKWEMGGRYMRIKSSLIDLPTAWPTLYCTYTQGQVYFADLRIPYQRIDVKASQTFRAPGFGNSGITAITGRVIGEVPYGMLWTGRASYQDATAIVTNSFETMRFNEFLADRYAALFIVHNFDPIEIKGFPYFPYFSFVHNMGWGRLDASTLHGLVATNDMQKGYFESGFFINDLFVFNLAGLRTGLGAGAFARYGYYSRPSTWDNAVFKFALKLGV